MNVPADDSLRNLKGSWLAFAEETGGKRIKKEEMQKKQKTLRVDGDTFTLSTTYYKIVGKITPVPDDGPNAIDLSGEYVEGGNGKALLLRAIFDIRGDTLRLCYSYNFYNHKNKRPREFETEEGQNSLCVTFQRIAIK